MRILKIRLRENTRKLITVSIKQTNMKQLYGLIMFIVGFLGLTFLITSGCILYFKQMDESEEEKPELYHLKKAWLYRKGFIKRNSNKTDV